MVIGPSPGTCSRRWASARWRIETLTPFFGSSRTIGTPRLTEAGTASEFGMLTAIGVLMAVTTSSGRRPTLVSALLRTMTRASLGLPSMSSVSMATRRFFTAGMSSVAMRTSEALMSHAARTCSVNEGGVSTMTKS